MGDVVRRVVAVRAWPLAPAELAVAIRQESPERGGLALSLERGEIVRSYAFRGGSYVMTHDTAAAILAVRGTTRVWESSRYQRQGSFALEDWAPWRAAARDALGKGPATRAEIWERSSSSRRVLTVSRRASAATWNCGSPEPQRSRAARRVLARPYDVGHKCVGSSHFLPWRRRHGYQDTR